MQRPPLGNHSQQHKPAVQEIRGILPLPLNRTQPDFGNLAPRPGVARYGNPNPRTSNAPVAGLLPRPQLLPNPPASILPPPAFSPAMANSPISTPLPQSWMPKRRSSLKSSTLEDSVAKAPLFSELARLQKIADGPQLQLMEAEEEMAKKMQELHQAKIQNQRAHQELALAKEVKEARAKALKRALAVAQSAMERMQTMETKNAQLQESLKVAGEKLDKAQHDWLNATVGSH